MKERYFTDQFWESWLLGRLRQLDRRRDITKEERKSLKRLAEVAAQTSIRSACR